MEKDTGSFEDIARNKLAQAIDDLESADILLGADKYRAANNRAYYAVFHAIDAVLSMEPVAFKKHKDVIAYFNKNYVNKDVFSRDMGRKISKLEIIRHKSDYDDFYIASKLDTVNQVTIAKEIIGEIKTYLNMEPWEIRIASYLPRESILLIWKKQDLDLNIILFFLTASIRSLSK